MNQLLPIVLVAFMLSGCGDRGTPVRVSNDSSQRVWDLKVRGNGFEAFVGQLQPGESVSIDVHPAGESGIALEFLTATGTVEIPPDGYLEGGGMYSATVTISENLSVEVDTKVRSL